MAGYAEEIDMILDMLETDVRTAVCRAMDDIKGVTHDALVKRITDEAVEAIRRYRSKR